MAKHTRDDVIKWWAENPGCLAREVRSHFIALGSDFPEATIYTWRHRVKLKGEKSGDGQEAGLNGEGRAKTPLTDASRVRVPPEKLERLADSTKRKLRKACEGATDFLASAAEWRDRAAKGESESEADDDATPFDWRQWEACARGLKTLIDFAPGVDSFDEQTAGVSAARGATTEDRKRLDEAMFGPPGEGAAPALRLVDTANK